MDAFKSAGERKRARELQRQREEAEAAKNRKSEDVGSTSYEIKKRLERMEELQQQGKAEASKAAKKGLWNKLAEQSRRNSDAASPASGAESRVRSSVMEADPREERFDKAMKGLHIERRRK